MKELLIIAISSALVSNVVLSQFLGICSFVGVSKKVETAAGMGGAVIFVITIASIVANLIFLPLITTNCAVLGVALTNVQNGYGFLQSVVNGVGTAVGYTISIVLLAGIREHIEGNDIPYNFQGSPIVLVTAGLMAIAFLGFSGLL